MLSHKSVVVLIILTFVAGVVVTKLTNSLFIHRDTSSDVYAVRQKGYTYIAPLLRCETPLEKGVKNLQQLSSKLNKYVDQSLQNNVAQNISVYFRDPDSGDWFVINEHDKYTPASLLKVPVMITYFKEADANPAVLSKKLEFEGGAENQKENIKVTSELKKGNTYTVDEMIKQAITESDNDANNVLLKNINEKEFENVFEEIGVGTLDYSQTEDFMSVKNYAYFFRILYNATYLSRNMSEKALALLSETKFTQGIAAGIPKNIKISHKFGERGYTFNNTKQLHDCGIVYYPNNPYLLCIMTRGTSFEDLESVIQTISSITYTEMNDMSKRDKSVD